MSTSARIVQAKVRHTDGVDCGGIEHSETADENYRSDPWLDGANLANQHVWGDVWKVILNHQDRDSCHPSPDKS